MPNYKTHVLSALICYYVILLLILLCGEPEFDFNIAVIWLIAIISGSVFPDVDIKSKGQRLFYFIFLLIIFLAVSCKNYLIATAVSLFSFAPVLSKHRGLFHNVWFLTILIISVSKILICNLPEHKSLILSSTIFFAIGVKLHIFLDFKYKKIFKRK